MKLTQLNIDAEILSFVKRGASYVLWLAFIVIGFIVMLYLMIWLGFGDTGGGWA